LLTVWRVESQPEVELMASRTLLAPGLICSLLISALVPGLAHAASPDEAPAAEPAPEAVVVVPPVEAPATTTAAPMVDDAAFTESAPTEDLYIEPVEPYEPYEPEPERRTTLKLDSGYVSFGIGPGMTIHSRGFHPNTRFEFEFGGTLEHRYRDLALSFGVAPQMTAYYERKSPSFGADVTSTLILGPIYLRTGLGAVGGLPRGHMLHNTAAAVGGVVGVGLNFGREPMVRVGVDYDLRVNTRLEPVHTFFLSVRIACCRKD
jgi:hypothetical protein